MYGLFESTVLLFFFDLALARTSGQSLTMYNLNAALRFCFLGVSTTTLIFRSRPQKKSKREVAFSRQIDIAIFTQRSSRLKQNLSSDFGPPRWFRGWSRIPEHNKKLSYCWDSSRYDKISHSGRSANPNRNTDLCKLYFANRVVNTRNSVPSYVA